MIKLKLNLIKKIAFAFLFILINYYFLTIYFYVGISIVISSLYFLLNSSGLTPIKSEYFIEDIISQTEDNCANSIPSLLFFFHLYTIPYILY